MMILGSAVVARPWWPRWFSRQNPINMADLSGTASQETIAIFNNKPVTIPKEEDRVLGQKDQIAWVSNKWIGVDLTNQTVHAYENGVEVFSFVISSGLWDRTPRGTFYIWTKVRRQKMSGGSKELGTYYYLPNVEYVMFFYNDKTAKKLGYSFHGTYWHNNFGVPMSHGCINMKTDEAGRLYDWAEVGTKVEIWGKYSTKTALGKQPSRS